MRDKDPSPITEVEVPMAVETNFWIEGFSGDTCLESNVIWSVAPESIIHVLLKTSVEVLRTLPTSLVVAIYIVVLSIRSSIGLVSAAMAREVDLDSSSEDHGCVPTNLDIQQAQNIDI